MPLFAGIGSELQTSEQPAGGLVEVDTTRLGQPKTPPNPFSMNPGGTTLVGDAWGPGPADARFLQGIGFDPDDRLFASTCETGCDPEGTSMLIEIDPADGSSRAIGSIMDGTVALNINDLAFDPTSGVLYGLSSFSADPMASCGICLYTIDTVTGAAIRVGSVGGALSGGLAFAADGTLYATTFINSAFHLLELDPLDAALIRSEAVLLEQQFFQNGGGRSTLVTSSPFGGLAVAPDGTLVASGDAITLLFERVFDTVKDPDGNVIGDPTWVWRVMGDTGENITDLAFPVPEPTVLPLLLSGLAVLAHRRRRARAA
jgi:outer membrane protein assembly factor BamB